MSAVTIVNEAGEILGIEYVYGDDGYGTLGDAYDDDFGPDDAPNCKGHATVDETSGDASEQADGSWKCDYGVCPTESK